MNRRTFLCGLTLGTFPAPLAAVQTRRLLRNAWRYYILAPEIPLGKQEEEGGDENWSWGWFTELVINGKTAKALFLMIPPSLLLRADHVIE